MSKTAAKIAADADSRMQREGKQVMTVLWPDFLKDADIQRYTSKRSDEIWESCKALGLVFGEGNHVVTFVRDANFAA